MKYVLQIRRDKEDNLGLIFFLSLQNISCDPALEPFH